MTNPPITVRLSLLILLLGNPDSLAQAVPSSRIQRVSVAYSGETIFHYGLNGAYQRYLGGQPARRNRLFYGINGTAYRHPKNHVGLMALPELGYAYVAPTGFWTRVSAQAGYMRRFYDGETFTVDKQGQVRKRPWAGTNALAYGFSISLGWDFGDHFSRQISLFIQPKLLWEYPYNTKALGHPFVDMGISRLF